MNQPSHIFSVLVPDRNGIIHSIVDTLNTEGVTHHEISQTVVHGTFTIALVVSMPDSVSTDHLKQQLVKALGETAQVSALHYVDAAAATTANDRYVLTATGKSVSGSIRALTQVMSQRGGNFIDFSSRVVGDEIQLVAEVELPADVMLNQLQSDLRHASTDSTLQVRLQHQKLFSATNEVSFRRKSNA